VDQDGYAVAIDSAEAWTPSPDDTTRIALSPGAHRVELSGLATNCAVSGENPRTVPIVQDDTSGVQFDVVCAPAGGLQVFVITSPGDPDPDGYFFALNDGPRSWIPVTTGLWFPLLAPGDYEITLSDVAPNCRLSGPGPVPVASDSVTTINVNVVCGPLVAMPPGHDLALQASGPEEIYLLSADGSRFVNLSNNPEDDLHPSWSPDGQRIAFASGHYVSGPNPRLVRHIYVMNADGSGRTQLTNGDPEKNEREDHPAWSPDGTRIAYSGGGIFVMNPDGTGVTRLTDADDVQPAWSPDGGRIAFSRGYHDIYVMNADGSGLTQLTSGAGSDRSPAWSPDGRKIAFQRGVSIYVMNFDGTGVTQLTFGFAAEAPAWSPDGKKIAYYLERNRVYLMNVDGSGEVPLTPTFETGSWVPEAPAWRP
jgi:TolB protein